jgi:hypothetical protein
MKNDNRLKIVDVLLTDIEITIRNRIVGKSIDVGSIVKVAPGIAVNDWSVTYGGVGGT